ncbi:MAG: succinylglutamate desuccinylase/aspartoacylase family protein [Pseudomonadota bacterium]
MARRSVRASGGAVRGEGHGQAPGQSQGQEQGIPLASSDARARRDGALKAERAAPFLFGGQSVAPGTRALIDLPVALLSNHTPVTLPVHVIHGRRAGPTVFISAAIHGDEVVGIEIIRRLLNTPALKRVQGTLLLIPIVNAFGFIAGSRYLPDRRDLNRAFPGAAKGSLAGQLAHLFLNDIAMRCELGIDLHTGAINRTNLPQLRGDFSRPALRELAVAFGAPVILQSRLREGSLRAEAAARGVDVLLYEAGEALRLDELAIRVGVRGVLNILAARGLIRGRRAKAKAVPVIAQTSRWIRAPEAGLFQAVRAPGDSVSADDVIGRITNPYEGTIFDVRASGPGIIIGGTTVSVVNQADALFHIADVARPEQAEDRIGLIAEAAQGGPIFDEDEDATEPAR